MTPSPATVRRTVRRAPRAAIAAAALAALSVARPALACGVTVGGEAGISACSLDEHEEAARDKWDVGASYAFTSTALRFGGDLRFNEERNASLVVADYRLSRRVTLQGGAGVFLGGDIAAGSTQYDMAQGFVGVIGASWRVIDEAGARPFVLLTTQLSYASTAAQDAAYNALDLRLGAVVGTTLFKVLTPYVLGRGFGGPIYWEYNGHDVTGQDVYHYQVGAGLSLLIARKASVFAEGVPLGERGLAAGAGFSF